jgi:TonB family protein
MFTTLIESTPHRQPNSGARVVSALFHSALIAGAIYATASGAASKVVATAGTQAQKVLWVKPSAQPQSAPAPKPKPKPRPIVAPTKVPTAAPRLDPNAQPTPEPDAGSTNLAGGGAPGAFNSFEVDVEVVAIAGTIRPQYPNVLRSSGTEGQVIAQFVVNEKGRADPESFRVLSSTHPLFTGAVTRALPYMRFNPATIRGKPVSQLVQQLFVFKLDR